MAAAPFKVTLQMMDPKGVVKSFFCTASDVNAAAIVFPSGGTELVLAPFDLSLIDVIYSPTYGTDTTTISLFIGGIDTGLKIVNSANQTGTIQRQLVRAPVRIPGGSTVKFVQNT